MSFFKKLFGGSDTQETASSDTSISKAADMLTISRSKFNFGRYTDRNKTDAQRQFWSDAVKKYDDKDYVGSLDALLQYIKDSEIDNVKHSRNGNSLTFEMIQGSSSIKGTCDGEKLTAIADIAVMNQPSVPAMRKLMSMNYGLKYSKFALNNDRICMKFTTYMSDASPNKLYYGLREMARKADQQDDLLIGEFGSISSVGEGYVETIPEEKKEVLVKYLKTWIKETLDEIQKHDREKFCGGIAFLLLRLSYRIDYLIQPQGRLTESLEKIHGIFFSKSNDSTSMRNDKIIQEFNSILEWPDEKLKEGMYKSISTFAIVDPKDHKPVMDMVFDEMKKADWYVQNHYNVFVDSIFEYSIAYSFFIYGMFYPTMHIFDLVMEVYNPEFYKEMGCSNEYVKADGTLNSTAINKRLKAIVSASKKEFPKIDFRVENIKFTSKIDFFRSMMTEADYLNYSK